MSKTEQDLKDAFAGESQANRKYLAFAKARAVLAETALPWRSRRAFLRLCGAADLSSYYLQG